MEVLRVAIVAGAVALMSGCGGGGSSMPDSPGGSDASGSASSDKRLWAVGQTTPFRWSGTTWESESGGLPITAPSGKSFAAIADIVVFSETEAWAVATRTDGSGSSMTFASILARWDGTSWSEAAEIPDAQLTTIWGSASGDIWLGGITATSPSFPPAVLFHWDGSAATQVHAGVDGESAFTAHAWGLAKGEVYFGVANAILRFDGTNVTRDFHLDNVACDGFWGTSAVDVWATCSIDNSGVVTPRIMQRQGGSWTVVPFSGTALPRAIHGRSMSDVWIAGFGNPQPEVDHFDGSAWSVVTLPNTLAARLFGIWAASDGVWAVGEQGTVIRYDGTSWTTIPSGTTDRLTKIVGIE